MMVFRIEGSIKKQWLKTRDQPLFWGADLIKYFFKTPPTLNFTDRCTLSWQELNVHHAVQSHTKTYSYNFMDNPWLF